MFNGEFLSAVILVNWSADVRIGEEVVTQSPCLTTSGNGMRRGGGKQEGFFPRCRNFDEPIMDVTSDVKTGTWDKVGPGMLRPRGCGKGFLERN